MNNSPEAADEARLVECFRLLGCVEREEALLEIGQQLIASRNEAVASAARTVRRSAGDSEAQGAAESDLNLAVLNFLFEHCPSLKYLWAWQLVDYIGGWGFEELLNEIFVDGALLAVILGPSVNDEVNAALIVEYAFSEHGDHMRDHPNFDDIVASLTQESALQFIREWRGKVMKVLREGSPQQAQ